MPLPGGPPRNQIFGELVEVWSRQYKYDLPAFSVPCETRGRNTLWSPWTTPPRCDAALVAGVAAAGLSGGALLELGRAVRVGAV